MADIPKETIEEQKNIDFFNFFSFIVIGIAIALILIFLAGFFYIDNTMSLNMEQLHRF